MACRGLGQFGAHIALQRYVSKVLVALDVTKVVATEARETGCDMILAHHPLLFEPKRHWIAAMLPMMCSWS